MPSSSGTPGPTLRATSCGILIATLVLGARLRAQHAAPPADAMALIKQGQQLDRGGDHARALGLYRQAVHVAPDFFAAHLALGMALDLDGHYDEARRHLAQAIDEAPPEGRVQALRAMAISYAFTRNAKEAATYEQRAIADQTARHDVNGAAETADELARIYLETGNTKAAYHWYRIGHETALTLPAMSDSASDLWAFRWEHAQARIAARSGDANAAEQHVRAAKAILDKGHIPDQARFFPYLTGYVAFYRGDYSAAITELAAADQHDPFILSLLAQAHEKAGDTAAATDLYRTILTIDTHNPPSAFARPLAMHKLAGT